MGNVTLTGGFHEKNKRNNTFTLILTDVFDLTIFNKEFQDHAGPQFTFRSYRTTNIFI